MNKTNSVPSPLTGGVTTQVDAFDVDAIYEAYKESGVDIPQYSLASTKLPSESAMTRGTGSPIRRQLRVRLASMTISTALKRARSS